MHSSQVVCCNEGMAKYNKMGLIEELDDGEVFVFGSNGAGAHMGGAAAMAVAKFGVVYGQAEGLQGQSYAINTMDGFEVMEEQASRFIEFAKGHPELKFLVTEIGCGIAGYTSEDVALLFADVPENVVLPASFSECNNSLQGMFIFLTSCSIMGVDK